MRALSSQLGLLLSASCLACAITQEVQPLSVNISQRVCIIENPAVRPVVLATYRETLEKRGYDVRVTSNALPADCPITSTYTARWSWDMTMYMGYAEINVLHDGETVGKAVYDVQMSASTRRFVDPAEKVRELVSQLFPQYESGHQ